jgi:hypothetical protein
LRVDSLIENQTSIKVDTHFEKSIDLPLSTGLVFRIEN